jgi:hypothetical protein
MCNITPVTRDCGNLPAKGVSASPSPVRYQGYHSVREDLSVMVRGLQGTDLV